MTGLWARLGTPRPEVLDKQYFTNTALSQCVGQQSRKREVDDELAECAHVGLGRQAEAGCHKSEIYREVDRTVMAKLRILATFVKNGLRKAIGSRPVAVGKRFTTKQT